MAARIRKDSVYDLHEFDGPEPELPPGTKRKPRRRSKRDIISCLVLALVVCFWTVRLLRRHALKSYFVLGCKSRQLIDLWEMGAGQKFPMKCPWCGSDDAFPVVQCVKCSELRFLASLYDASPCPHCGLTRLTRDLHKQCPSCRELYIERRGHKCPPKQGT